MFLYQSSVLGVKLANRTIILTLYYVMLISKMAAKIAAITKLSCLLNYLLQISFEFLYSLGILETTISVSPQILYTDYVT